MQECINDLNCSMCPVKNKYYKSLKRKKKHKTPSEWEEAQIQK